MNNPDPTKPDLDPRAIIRTALVGHVTGFGTRAALAEHLNEAFIVRPRWTVGQRVVAKTNITEDGFDGRPKDQRSDPPVGPWFHAEPGDLGTVVGFGEEYDWRPTVRFDRSGTATTTSMVEVAPVEDKTGTWRNAKHDPPPANIRVPAMLTGVQGVQSIFKGFDSPVSASWFYSDDGTQVESHHAPYIWFDLPAPPAQGVPG